MSSHRRCQCLLVETCKLVFFRKSWEEVKHTVSASLAAGGRSTVRSNSSETSSNSVASGRRGGLEVLLELASRARSCGSCGSSCQSVAVAQGRADGGQLGTGAIALDGGTLLELADGEFNLGSLGSVNIDGKCVTREREGTSRQNSRVQLGVGDRTGSKDTVCSTSGKLVEFGELDFDFNSLTSHEGLERLLGELSSSKTLQDTSEGSLGS